MFPLQKGYFKAIMKIDSQNDPDNLYSTEQNSNSRLALG